MKERRFAGMLNYRNRYGIEYSGTDVLRVFKYNKILDITRWQHMKWYNDTRFYCPSWGKSLWNDGKTVMFTQRHYNKEYPLRDRRVNLFPWRKHEN